MFPQPQPDHYYDGFNERLLAAVPGGPSASSRSAAPAAGSATSASARTRAGTSPGVELDAEAAQAAKERLDEVFVLDVQAEAPPVDAAGFDCLIFGDVLEHLVDPEDVLRRYRQLLAPGGVVLVSLPNIQHFSTVRSLLRGDFPTSRRGCWTPPISASSRT